MNEDEKAAVERFVREKGVTKLPDGEALNADALKTWKQWRLGSAIPPGMTREDEDRESGITPPKPE